MKNHFLSQFIVFVAIVLLFTLFLSQRGLSALAADSTQVETGTVTLTMTVSVTASPTKTVTPTASPTPSCDLIVPGSFVVTSNDQLQFTVANNNPQEVYLTNTTLYWTDFYDPNMLVDYFRFGGIQYWNGDSFSSPTSINSNIPFSGMTTADWELDFDGYGNIYGVTHTIGPFLLELTFNNSCMVSASIPAVFRQIDKPVENQIISDINETSFEAKAWDTGVGSQNGSGIERMHIVIIDSNGTVIVNRQDTSAPYCAWGSQSPCSQMPQTTWDNLPDGIYTMIAWGKSSVTASWSPLAVVNFSLLRVLPSPTPIETFTPTITPTPTKTPKPTRTNSPGGTNTSTPTSLPGATNTPTPRPTKTPIP